MEGIKTNPIIILLAVVSLVLSIYLSVSVYNHNAAIADEWAEYEIAIEKYENENIYYNPESIIQYVKIRQNPNGYFVSNPDLIFEPSELNINTMKTTRFSVLVLDKLNSTGAINRKPILNYIMSNYVEDIKFTDTSLGYVNYSNTSDGKKYAGFRAGRYPGVRTTLDALMVLEALDALDDPRIDLDRVENFILAHQNPDGGFWDEDYPQYGRNSSLTSTSFAMRALGRINQYNGNEFDHEFKENVATFINTCFDNSDGGYANFPGDESIGSYETFRAFISLWWLGGNTDLQRKTYVAQNMDINKSTSYLFETHYYPETGSFSRYEDKSKGHESLKATHLMVWFLKKMEMEDKLDRISLVRHVLGQESSIGEYGKDVYSTYAAVFILTSLDVPTKPMIPPEKPAKPIHIWTIIYLIGAIFCVYAAIRMLKRKGATVPRKLLAYMLLCLALWCIAEGIIQNMNDVGAAIKIAYFAVFISALSFALLWLVSYSMFRNITTADKKTLIIPLITVLYVIGLSLYSYLGNMIDHLEPTFFGVSLIYNEPIYTIWGILKMIPIILGLILFYLLYATPGMKEKTRTDILFFMIGVVISVILIYVFAFIGETFFGLPAISSLGFCLGIAVSSFAFRK